MNRKSVIVKTACLSGLKKNDIAKVLEILQKILIDAMQKGDIVSFSGFGKFYTKQRNERKFINFQTGESFIVPPKLVPVLKFSKKFVNKF